MMGASESFKTSKVFGPGGGRRSAPFTQQHNIKRPGKAADDFYNRHSEEEIDRAYRETLRRRGEDRDD